MKAIQINKIDDLYDLLGKNPDLVERHNRLCAFMDFMQDYHWGCQCLQEENLFLATNEYNSISNDTEVKKIILDYFSCEYIVFAKKK